MAKLQSICGLIREGDALSWCVVRQGKSQQEVLRDGAQDLPVEEGESGPVLESDLFSALRENRAAAIPRDVVIGMSATRALIRVLELPTTDASEIGDMVELQVDKFSPFPVETLSVGYEVLHQDEALSVVIVAAVQASEIGALGDAAMESGLKLHRVDLDVMAWWDLLRMRQDVVGSPARLDVVAAEDHLHMIFSSEGLPHLFRTMEIDPELPRGELIDDIVTEMRYALTAREARNLPALAGGGFWYRDSESLSLGDALADGLGISLAPEPQDSLGSVTQAVASRSLRQKSGGLDLSLSSWHDAKLSSAARKKVLKTAGAVLGTWIALMATIFGAVFFEQHQLNRLSAERALLEPQEEEAKTLRSRLRILKMYQRRDNSSLECLRSISARLPAGIELSRFTYSREKPLEIRGVAREAEAIYMLRDALRKETIFVSAELEGNITRGPSGEQFTMLIEVVGLESRDGGSS